MSGTTLWTIHDVAQHIGATSTGSARRTLSRWGIQATSRQPGRAGASLYDPDAVRTAHAARPGRGYRSDIRTHPNSDDQMPDHK